MSMKKKHFEALAAAVRCTRLDGNASDTRELMDAVAGRMATVCAQFNPNFDRARFLKACGVEAK